MLERDGFPPGVPCWVDTLQPNPDAAVAFYGNLFGWEFVDRMPPDVSGSYYIARLRGRDVAAVGSQLEDAEPSTTGIRTSGSTAPTLWRGMCGSLAAPYSSSRSLSSTLVAWQSVPTRRVRCSSCGSRVAIGVPKS